ncbi:MAG: calcium-binding protein, partial [Fuerstia sp.]|nr:calcium-binding protein [Fuerstiella sp.]
MLKLDLAKWLRRYMSQVQQASGRSHRRRAPRVTATEVAVLETRTLLAATITYDLPANSLLITGSDVAGGTTNNVTVDSFGANKQLRVTTEDGVFTTFGGNTVLASQVESITIQVGVSDDVVNLSGVTTANGFVASKLNSAIPGQFDITIDGGAGADTLTGSEFNDNVIGGSSFLQVDGEDSGRVNDPQLAPPPGLVLDEQSGLAFSRSNASGFAANNVIYTVEDAGNGTQVFMNNAVSGATLGYLALPATVVNTDWEDLSYTFDGTNGWIYIADIGDSGGARNIVTIYRVREQATLPGGGAQVVPAADVTSIRLQYPNNVARDAETMFTDPLTGDLYIVSKSNDAGAHLYRAAAPASWNNSVVPLFDQGATSFGANGDRFAPSGAAISPDGLQILIRNDMEIRYYSRQSAAQTIASAIVGIQGVTVINGERPNGLHNREAVAFSRGMDAIVTVADRDGATGTPNASIWRYVFRLDGNDIMTGSSGNDSLTGALGNDSLNGGTGNDTYVWNAQDLSYSTGNDVVTEASGGGTDLVDFSNFTAGVTVDLNGTGVQTVATGLRIQFAASGLYVENATGSNTGADTLTGNSVTNVLRGGGGNDLIAGNGGNDLIYGDAGNDTLFGDFNGTPGGYGGTWNDDVYGGDGDDTIYGDNLNYGGYSYGGNDRLYGEVGNDTIVGDNRNGYGGAGSDTISGGDGIDTVYGDHFIEYYTYGYGAADTINGDAGNDLLYGDDGQGGYAGGSDIIHGNDGNDTIVGDLLTPTNSYGSSGNDVLYGDAGDDSIIGDNLTGGAYFLGTDTIYGGDGNDTIKGDHGTATTSTSGGNDVIYGDAGDDTITSDRGNDYAYGGSGNDSVDGGDGDDYVLGDNPWGANMNLNNGNDIVHGGAGNDAAYGGGGDDQVFGDDGNDYVFGDNGGNPGTGNDVLSGGRGADGLYGEAGDDRYVWTASDNVSPGSIDTVTEAVGNGSDTLDFSGLTAGVNFNLAITGTQTVATYISVNLPATEVENIWGSNTGGDILLGNNANNELRGNGGDDTLIGYGGNDLLAGGAGVDD